jgi:hypothetical protein
MEQTEEELVAMYETDKSRKIAKHNQHVRSFHAKGVNDVKFFNGESEYEFIAALEDQNYEKVIQILEVHFFHIFHSLFLDQSIKQKDRACFLNGYIVVLCRKQKMRIMVKSIKKKKKSKNEICQVVPYQVVWRRE